MLLPGSLLVPRPLSSVITSECLQLRCAMTCPISKMMDSSLLRTLLLAESLRTKATDTLSTGSQKCAHYRLQSVGPYELCWIIPMIWMTSWEPRFRCYRRSEEHTSELQSRGHLVCRRL